MTDMRGGRREAQPDSAFEFSGTWREFLPIALTNFLLIIVTLGIYRFWAKARERRYLWSRTRFIDDSFEWTGTGLEMFIGALIVFAIFLPVILFFQFGLQAMLLRGETLAAGLLAAALYLGIFYLIGVGTFRALRYRLSRTFWHGIRGGSADGGWHFGWQWMWKSFVGALVLGLLIPWSKTSLWNDRWNLLSFGEHRFEAGATPDGLWARWLLIYLTPVVGLLMMGIFGLGGAWFSNGGEGAIIGAVIAGLLFYLLFLVLSVSFYAAFYRHVASATSIAGLEFEFTARTMDWLKLILGNIALVVLTLGFGLMLVGYRNWAFVIRHMEASGEVDLDRLLQSKAYAPGEAEGLADAFDIGAI